MALSVKHVVLSLLAAALLALPLGLSAKSFEDNAVEPYAATSAPALVEAEAALDYLKALAEPEEIVAASLAPRANNCRLREQCSIDCWTSRDPGQCEFFCSLRYGPPC